MQKVSSYQNIASDDYCMPSPPKPMDEAALDESYVKTPTLDCIDRKFFAYRRTKILCSASIRYRDHQTYELNGMRFGYAEKSAIPCSGTIPLPRFFIDPLLKKEDFIVPWSFSCSATGNHPWTEFMTIRPATLEELQKIEEDAMRRTIVFSSDLTNVEKVQSIVRRCIIDAQSEGASSK